MHYQDLQTDEDKIIHALSAARQNGIYGKVMVEYVQFYGEDKVQAAIAKFKTEYKQTYDRF
jgi:hypothetical protein